MVTCEKLRGPVKWAISQGADILASGDGLIEWRGHRATVTSCPGGLIVTFDSKMVTVCTEEQLGHVLLVIDQEMVRG